MTTTVDRLAKALERAEDRLEEANAIIRSLHERINIMNDAAKSAPYRQYDGDRLARELGSVAANSKIAAIKIHRTFSGSDLKAAKDAVERYWPNRVSQ